MESQPCPLYDSVKHQYQDKYQKVFWKVKN